MRIPLDYRDLLKLLNKHRAQYLIVGAYAVIYYTEPRYTKDLDILVNPSIKNAHKVWKALKEFGAPLKGVKPQDFTREDLVYQIGVAPIRVDVMMNIPKINFSTAWKRRTISSFEGVKVNIMGVKELIDSKSKIKRHIDISDVENLKYTLKTELFRKQKS
jgi:predicted nucleotidyltransferase